MTTEGGARRPATPRGDPAHAWKAWFIAGLAAVYVSVVTLVAAPLAVAAPLTAPLAVPPRARAVRAPTARAVVVGARARPAARIRTRSS